MSCRLRVSTYIKACRASHEGRSSAKAGRPGARVGLQQWAVVFENTPGQWEGAIPGLWARGEEGLCGSGWMRFMLCKGRSVRPRAGGELRAAARARGPITCEDAVKKGTLNGFGSAVTRFRLRQRMGK